MNRIDLKACALLLPSPYAAFDPGGEDARRAEIEAWLGRAGVDVAGVDRGLLARCAEEAHDALVPFSELPPVMGVPLLLHPLSTEEQGGRGRVRSAEELLDRLPRPEGAPDAAWYAKLWRALMQHPIYRETPADGRVPDHTLAAHRSLTAALAEASLAGGRPALLALHVGPVQSFIEAARRTHDLSLGSYTVGFLAFAGALSLARALGPDALVNPDVSCRALADRLLFEDEIDEQHQPELLRAALMNKVLAVVPEARGEELARAAMAAVWAAWETMGKEAWRHLALFVDPEQSLRGFRQQIEAHLEIDAVVQRWPENNDEVKALLGAAGRAAPPWLDDARPHAGAACGLLMKLTEDVLGAHRGGVEPQVARGDRRPKCTVCGLFEQMGPIEEEQHASHQQGATRAFWEKLSADLQQRGRDPEDHRPSLQIVHGEGLCAVCLTKRFAPEVYYGADAGGLGLRWASRDRDRPLLRFPSIASVASAPLRLRLYQARADQAVRKWLGLLDALHGEDALDFTRPRNLLGGLGPIGDDTDVLAHDGVWLYDSAYDPDVAWRSHHAREAEGDEDRVVRELIPRAREAFADARGAVEGAGASPYYAVVVLDGDDMGRWKSGDHDRTPKIRELAPAYVGPFADQKRPLHPALHGELSQRVARLGLDLHEIVDRYLGRLVYHGGDDLIALLPLATALPCLHEIRGSFRSARHLGDRVTISAGVAVAHWHEPLSRALDAARAAEKAAKAAGRDRFAVHADKRSGEDLDLVLPWRVGELEVIPTLQEMLARRGDDPLAGTKAAYQLREELRALDFEELHEAFLARVDRLVFGDRDDVDTPRALLTGLVERIGPKGVVDLLAFLRFLLREEHEIVTAELLAALPKKEPNP